MSAFTSRLSAVIIVAAATAAACAGSSPPATTPAVPGPNEKVAKAEARPAAPLPTTLLPGIGMSTSHGKSGLDDDDDEEPAGPPPACSKDEDCWSRTCCPAKVPEDCVHASHARKCAIVDVTCKPSPMHYTCVCDAGACKGRLAPP